MIRNDLKNKIENSNTKSTSKTLQLKLKKLKKIINKKDCHLNEGKNVVIIVKKEIK